MYTRENKNSEKPKIRGVKNARLLEPLVSNGFLSFFTAIVTASIPLAYR